MVLADGLDHGMDGIGHQAHAVFPIAALRKTEARQIRGIDRALPRVMLEQRFDLVDRAGGIDTMD